MLKTPRIFGIPMSSQKNRRWLIIVCYAACCILVWLPSIPSSRTAQFLMGFITAWWICIAVIFYKLAKDTVIPMQETSRPVGLGLFHNAFPAEDRSDERIIAVRNTAYYKAYRIAAECSLLVPVLLLGVSTLNKALLGMVAGSLYVLVFTLPQAVILWTEPDIPEEAI
jgi:hypothetical protein